MTSVPTLVLVHGAWQGPWCWELLIEQFSGVEHRAVALSSSGAHSYGGAPVTEALAGMGQVRRLVYLCAWQLDVGESL